MTDRSTYSYPYPRPMVTVDAVVFVPGKSGPEVLLVQRDNPPFRDAWALPGGFLEMDETLEQAVARELEEETGLVDVPLKQFHTFSAVDRDPRGRTITTAFLAQLESAPTSIQAGSDAAQVAWHAMKFLPELAFDHREIIELAYQAREEAT